MDKSDKLFYRISAGLVTAAAGLIAYIYSTEPTKGQCREIVEPIAATQQQVQDQTGKMTDLRELLARSVSGEKAKEYVKNLAEKAYQSRNGTKYNTPEDKADLAENVIGEAIDFLKEKKYGGQGNYTKGYEYSEAKEKWTKEAMEDYLEPEESLIDIEINLDKLLPEGITIDSLKKQNLVRLISAEFLEADSTQTFDEFYGPKNGVMLAGDCDDFSIALTTVYHGLKDYSEKNQDREFFKSLTEGFRNYTMTSVFIPGHALNLSIKTLDTPEFKVIDLTEMDHKKTVAYTSPLTILSKPDTEKICISDTGSLYWIVSTFNKDFTSKGLQVKKVCKDE